MATIAPAMKAVFAAEHDVPVPYMQRTRDYYLALGFAAYRWAHFVEAPFAPLRTPLSQARVGLITTAAPYQPEAGDQGPGAPYNAAAKFYQVYSIPTETEPDLRISHVGYDRLHTSAKDINTYLPLARLKDAVAAGRIGSLAPRVHGAPTNRSHRVTMETDAPELLRRCSGGRRRRRRARSELTRVPPDRGSGCPAPRGTRHPDRDHGLREGHRRALRRPALSVERFPARQPAGRPFDFQSQAETLELALRVLETAPAARPPCSHHSAGRPMRNGRRTSTTSRSSHMDQIAERRKEFEVVKAVAKSKREGT